MKKIVLLFVILTSFSVVNSYGQTPTTPVPENKVADFKILTPEEAQKVEIEKQKKAEEVQILAKNAEFQAQKDAERKVRKAKSKPIKVVIGIAAGVGAFFAIRRIYYYNLFKDYL